MPVPEEDLPVVLPEDAEFKPTGESPLRTHPDFLHVECPSCGGDARREIDTMDTFVDSSWYYYRYLSPGCDTAPFDNDVSERWTPVDLYSGGREHAVMHLLYTRFWTKAMRDCGLVRINEPFKRLVNQGFILGEDSEKMSKSRGNVIDPDDLVASLGRGHRPAVPDVHAALGYDWPLGQPGRHRRPSLPGSRLVVRRRHHR